MQGHLYPPSTACMAREHLSCILTHTCPTRMHACMHAPNAAHILSRMQILMEACYAQQRSLVDGEVAERQERVDMYERGEF